MPANNQWHMGSIWEKEEAEVVIQYDTAGTDWEIPAAQCAGYPPVALGQQMGQKSSLGSTNFWKLPTVRIGEFPDAQCAGQQPVALGQQVGVSKGPYRMGNSQLSEVPVHCSW